MQDDEEMYIVRAFGTKVCPQCGQTLFDDMDVCYGCLYEFGREEKRTRAAGKAMEPTDEGMQTVVSEVPSLSGEEWLGGEVPTEAYERGWVAAEDAPVASEEAKAPQQLWVRICSGDMEVSVPLPRQGLLVGRGADCDVVLRGRSVSRRHVLMVPDGEGCRVHNQDAKNPATLGKEKVTGEVSMRLDEELDVCGTTFTLVQV